MKFNPGNLPQDVGTHNGAMLRNGPAKGHVIKINRTRKHPVILATTQRLVRNQGCIMTSKPTLTGQCLCGAVKVSGAAQEPKVDACHCEMCRRWGSGPFFEVTCSHVRFDGAENITKIRSSDWAERGFCNKCGSNLFYHIIDHNAWSEIKVAS